MPTVVAYFSGEEIAGLACRFSSEGPMTCTFRLNIVFTGIDFDDDRTFDVLAELPNVAWRSQGKLAYATIVVEAPTALKAADAAVQRVARLVPTARPVRLDDDLVSISDVAGRVGVTREAVRHWANGVRQSNFPIPRGIVGDGIKVWGWAEVNAWLQANLGVGDAESFPSAHDAALINAKFAESGLGHSVAIVPAAKWTFGESSCASAITEVAPATSRRPDWVLARRGSVRLEVVNGGRYVAA